MSNTNYGNLKANTTVMQSSDIFYAKFTNNGSDSMNINGTTPVIFTLEDIPDGDFILERVTFLIGADIIVDLDKFGDIDELTNGVKLSINEGLVQERTLINKNNGDVLLSISFSTIDSTSFASTEHSVINGVRDYKELFGSGVAVIDNNISVTIQDDLSSVKYFKVSCHGVLIDSQ